MTPAFTRFCVILLGMSSTITPVLIDAATLRDKIYDKATKALQEAVKLNVGTRALTVEDINISRREFSPDEQKKALLRGDSLRVPVKGTLVLRDANGKELDRAKDFTLVHLPYLTERHTVIADGNEYQFANQLRRKPGVYTQQGENGEIKTVFNLGRGANFDLGFNGAKGTFALQYGTSNIPLYAALRGLGVSHADIATALGPELAKANAVAQGHQTETAINKLYEKLVPATMRSPGASLDAKVEAIKKRYAVTTLDPDVTSHTLGYGHSSVTPHALLDAAKKLVNVHKGQQDVDDTDSLAFKTFHAVDDFLAERLRLGAREWAPKAKRALNGKTDIRAALHPAPLTPTINKFVTTSSLTAVPSGINPMELIDHAVKVTALGEGGIPSDRAIPFAARMTHNTHFGALDPIRTPESNHAGVDIRATLTAHRDDKGNLFTVVYDVKNNKETLLKAGDLDKYVVAFPHEKLKGLVKAFVNGKVQNIDASKVTHQMLHVSHQYSPATSLIPMIHNIQGNRAIMGSKMGTQALPLVERETPYVQVQSPHGEDVSYETIFGHMVVPTAPVSGTVEKIKDGYIYIRPHGVKKAAMTGSLLDLVGASIDPDSEDFEKSAASDAGLVKVPFQENFPFPSKTFLHHTLAVKPGDKVQEGQRMGDSNYTRDGTLALGKNLLVGYIPYHGLNSNDAVVISESASKKLTSEHMYREVYPLNSTIELSKAKHRNYYGNKVTLQQYNKLDDTGVIKVGAKVDPKDPLVLGLTKTQIQGADLMLGRISKSLVKPYKEVSLLWEHGTPGTVVDVVRTGSQIAILVKTLESMNIGDKLCYDEETEVLTESGWKSFHAVKMSDKVATLQDGELKYELPSAKHVYQKGGEMYRLDTQQVDLFVTMDHNMWVRNPKEAGGTFAFKKARSIVGEHVEYKKDANWSGEDHPVVISGNTVRAGQAGRGFRKLPDLTLPAATYAMLLGAFVSEGNLVNQPSSGNYGIDITQMKSGNRAKLLSTLSALGIKFNEHGNKTKVRIYSKTLYEHFKALGKSYEKHLPDFVFSWSRSTLTTLFQWLMWGDGHTNATGRPICYTTTSPRLADDVQRLCLHIGYAANIKRRHKPVQVIKGRTYSCREQYAVRIITAKTTPEVNHHGKTSDSVVSNYARPVYCLTVPGGLLYVRRNGKPVWSGNCGRYGNKGVVSRIVPDHEMLKDEQGRPIDLLLTSAGVVSRINPAQIIETAVGKVAEKTGKPILYDNAAQHNTVQWARDLLKKHGVKDKEVLFDPVTGRHIKGSDGKGVLVGRQYIYKLFKSTDTNFSGHGVGPYDGNEQPLKTGGDESAKGVGKMELDAIIAHNARNILQENATIRSQKNTEFWRAIQLGTPLPTAKPTFAYNKFTAMLEGAGIKVDKRDSKIKLLPMTDRDVLARSKGAIENKKTLIAKNLKAEKGGLFDVLKTGGPNGTLYSHIELHEPIPNPVFVEPIRRLLGLTEKQFAQKLEEHGGAWFRDQLRSTVDVDARLKTLTEQMKTAKGADLDNVIKQIKYLRALKAEGLKPHEAYVISKVPVIPPVFRPVLPDVHNPADVSIGDANKLYGNLMDANDVLKNTALTSDLPKHRSLMFNAVGAVFGTHAPVDEKLKKQEVKGYLQNIAGVGTPKGGFFQRKLMRRTLDVSGRGTAVPDPNLGMDEVGIPEQMLWQMLDKLIVARLVRQGYSALQAREQVDKKTAVAKAALIAESKERPVIINRAPTLHRWSFIAAYPKPVSGKTIRVSPFIEKGMNLDFDGDTLQVHAPIQVGAVEDAKKMTLSNMLLSDQTRDKILAFPQHEAVIGVALASSATPKGAPVRKFNSVEEVKAAWRKGEVSQHDTIEVASTKVAAWQEDPELEVTGLTSEDALSLYPVECVTNYDPNETGADS